MSDFVSFLFDYLFRALLAAVPALGAYALILWLGWKRRGGGTPFPWKKGILGLLLLGYLAVVAYVTLGRSANYWTHTANFHLFRAWREAWNNFSEKNWMNLLLNIALFVPLGILPPLLWKKLQKWYRMIPLGLEVTLVIELAQYLSMRGLFDVDDLFSNTLGTAVGFFCLMAAVALLNRNWGRGLGNLAAALGILGALGSVFVVYAHQEYGNLPDAPAYRVDLSGVRWSITCQLDTQRQSVDIYRLDRPSREECEQIGRDVLKHRGVEEAEVTYYNEEVYLRERMGNRWIWVSYLDGTWDYFDASFYETQDREPEPLQRDETTVREALEDWGIDIPEGAEFYINARLEHCFAVDRIAFGDSVFTGKLRCMLHEGGIYSLTNELTALTFWKQAQIISPAEAAQRLQDGWLTDGEALARSQVLEIRSCQLSWQTDTKGFSQPVYLFEVVSESGEVQTVQMVPALCK